MMILFTFHDLGNLVSPYTTCNLLYARINCRRTPFLSLKVDLANPLQMTSESHWWEEKREGEKQTNLLLQEGINLPRIEMLLIF